ncbi:glycosyltransferase [Salinigranum rubrum]|uniref:glycosyltransferase n=1 Tax=Salinigranum rubrum TaxID=755307 RepID=UPI001FE51861|nr:glycosyltransferase [Salinigranum rubrum]
MTFLGFLDDYKDVLGHMRAVRVFASPSTREVFGIIRAEAMAAVCTVIAADHPTSAVGEVVDDAGYLVEPTVDGVAEALDHALSGERPPTTPTEHATRYDWDTVAKQAEEVYQRAIDTR